jgi:hypothetical protein
MGSTNISEITEITNKTGDTFYMYVWDNAHEGRYTPFNKDDWQYPSDGKWLKIGARAHLRADDCGIPDGGKSADKDRVRVIFKAKPGEQPSQGDPGRGLRINRVGLGDGNDELLFRKHSTGEKVTSVKLPTRMHQSLLLVLGGPGEGVQFQQTDIAVSGEAQLQEAGKIVGEVFRTSAEVFLKVMEVVA